MTDRLSPFRRWFEAFARSFTATDADAAILLELKRGHVARVAALASRIASESGADTDRLFLVELAALLHDVGRFPQVAKHKSYDDAASVNHARLGARIVHEAGLLGGLPVQARKAVLSAVAYHNRTVVPAHLPSLSRYVLCAVRDADKLDILSHIVGQLKPGDHLYRIISERVVWHETDYSPSVLEQLESRGVVHLPDVVYVNDFKLFLCGWINDFNFPAAFRLLAEFGDYGRLLDMLPSSSPMELLKKRLLARLGEGCAR